MAKQKTQRQPIKLTAKRQNLRRQNPRHPLLPITPPKQIRQPSPPRRIPPPPGRPLTQRQHKRQPPPLRLLPRLRIQLRNIIRIQRFRPFNPLAAEIRKLRDLIREHLRDGFSGEDPCVGGGRDAVVEERAEDLGVVGWARETACAGGVVDGGVFGGGGDEGAAVGVVAGADGIVGGPLVHVREVVFHLGGGEHGYVVQV